MPLEAQLAEVQLHIDEYKLRIELVQWRGKSLSPIQLEAEVEQRFDAQRLQLRRVAGFGRAVAEDAVIEQRRGHPRRDQGRRTDDEAVDQQGHLRFRRAQHGADHGPNAADDDNGAGGGTGRQLGPGHAEGGTEGLFHRLAP